MIDATEFINKGYENRVSRKELVDWTGYRDEVIRKQLSEKQIVVSADGGYFIPTPADEIYARRYASDLRSRAVKVLARAKAIDEYMGFNEVKGQIGLGL